MELDTENTASTLDGIDNSEILWNTTSLSPYLRLYQYEWFCGTSMYEYDVNWNVLNQQTYAHTMMCILGF